MDKANSSIQDFAQTKLLEMKSSLSTDAEPKTEDTPFDYPQGSKQPKELTTPQLDTKNKSKRSWLSWLK